MNSLLRTSLVLAPLLALIGGLWWFAPRPSDPGYQTTIGTLRTIALRQARLDRDVLRAHDGLSPDYDPINNDLADMRQATETLAADVEPHGWDRAALLALCTEIDREDEAVERFKTGNALIINSLAYVDLASTSLRSSGADLKTAYLTGQLATAVLHLVRAPTTSSADLVRVRLSEIDASLVNRTMSADLATAVATLRQHALLLAETVPAVDADLQGVFAHSVARTIRMMREAAVHRHETEEVMATRFEMAILLATAVLLALAVRLGVLLRVMIKRQRRHTALERAIAQVSTDLVAQLTGSDGKADALAKLGAAFGADRALLTLDETPPALWYWSKLGEMASERWSDTIRALHEEAALRSDDLLRLPDVAKSPDVALRVPLLQAGVVACFGVVFRRQNHPCGLFLLQRTQSGVDWAPDEGLLRMAGDVLGNAVRRQIEERKRSELEERLVQVRRLEAIGAFASGIAHNFNNVIGAVLGHAEMAEDGLPESAAASHHVQEIRRAGERAQDLVGRILEFGTRRQPSRELLAIDEFVAETTSLLRGSLTEGDLVAVPGAPGCFIDADTVQLQQVVINLVRNGVQASSPCTAVTIRTSCEDVTAPRLLSHGSLVPGHWVCLVVEDHGTGMDAAVLRQMFNPFFTTRPAGTGLGLATARDIVHDHGGMLDVTSQPFSGTTITMWLPLAQAHAEPHAAKRPGNGQTILVLAADEATVQRDEEMLAALGYEPVGFTTLNAMMAALLAGPDRFDAMLLSADLIEAANWAPLAETSRLAPNCPVIVTLCAAVDARELPRRDVATVLHRPLRSSSVATALAYCLRENVGASSQAPFEDSYPLESWIRG